MINLDKAKSRMAGSWKFDTLGEKDFLNQLILILKQELMGLGIVGKNFCYKLKSLIESRVDKLGNLDEVIMTKAVSLFA